MSTPSVLTFIHTRNLPVRPVRESEHWYRLLEPERVVSLRVPICIGPEPIISSRTLQPEAHCDINN